MSSSKVKKEALGDLALLGEVRDFTMAFYNRGWSNFADARPGAFHLVPPSESLTALMADYEAMKVMIFEDAPEFDIILEDLSELEDEINSL